jgi:hypothetical protein
MTDKARTRLAMTDDRLDDLLSEVWHADTQANNPRTREFLEAGEELLHRSLARGPDTPDAGSGRTRAPFDKLLAWVSRRRVVDQAASKKAKKANRPNLPTDIGGEPRLATSAISSYMLFGNAWLVPKRQKRPLVC